MVAGTYDDVSEFLDMRVESQLEESAAMLVAAISDRAAKASIDLLKECGLIDPRTARHLGLELVGRMGWQPRDAGVIQDDAQAEIAALEPENPEPPPALEDVAEPDPEPEFEVVEIDGVRLCPICYREGKRTRLSPGRPGKPTVGCLRHWRQVKREARERGGSDV